MQKKKWQSLALVLTLCMGLSIPLSACAAEAADSNPEDIGAITNYDTAGQENAGGSGKFEIKDGSVTFPEKITSIEKSAFANNDQLTSVVIPEGVTSIGAFAFEQCENLTSVTLPESLTSIGSRAFADCVKLESIVLPKSLTELGYSAFYGCTALTSVTLSDGLTKIDEEMFRNCESLTSIVIPESVTEICQGAFSNCTNLKAATIPASVKTFGESVFLDCPDLTIHGIAGSDAETCAKGANIPFSTEPAGTVNPASNTTTTPDTTTPDTTTPDTTTPDTDTTPAAIITFTDVAETSSYIDGIRWAVEKKITTGTGDGTTFSPNRTCNVGEILTFLWRANGSPEPTIENPYSDYDAIPGAFQKAALWAYEKGLMGTNKTFNADMACTRSMTVTYLWMLAGKPEAESAATFSDVSSESGYADAVSWAVEKGITTGTGDGTTFEAEKTCTRGQIVTFLYRDLASET